MARPEIVAPGAAYAVAADAKSLWIAPDLWKTHRTRFPQGPWTAHRTRRPHAPQASLFSFSKRKRQKPLRRCAAVLDTQRLA
jgi:hypothetical protein